MPDDDSKPDVKKVAVDFAGHPAVHLAQPEARSGALRRGATVLVALLLAIALPGCEEHVVNSTWDQFENLAHGGGRTTVEGGTIAHPQRLGHHHNTWAVEVTTFAGENRSTRAAKLVKTLKGDDGFDTVWLRDNSGLMRVLVGKFDSPDSGDAEQELEKIRRLHSGGTLRYPNAELTSLTTQGKKVYGDPLDLRVYHNEYTLQIGFYDGPQHRQNAEQAVKSLRDRGVDAYYYNGPNRSLITVGMFTKQQAFVTRKDPYSPAGSVTYVQAYSDTVVQLQKRFPYNLGNGRTIKQTVRGKNAGTQESCLVQTPG